MIRRIPQTLVSLGLATLAVAACPSPAVAGPPTTDWAGSAVGGDQLAGVGPVVHYLPGAAPLPTLKATAWVLADLTTGQVLAAQNAHARLRPASTLKTLTSLTVLQNLPLDTRYRATATDARAEGSRVGVLANATYTVKDLLHGLLLPSGNDAASSLAHANGGFRKTVSAMNAEAAHLQAFDTHAVNPSGLDADGQVSSAYDLALIARAAMRVPDFRAITGSRSYAFPGKSFPGTGKRTTYRIYSQNRLLLHGFRGAMAGKTGFTTKAGRTYWGAATRRGHTLVVTLMQIAEPTETAAKALLAWGFRNQARLAPVGNLVDPAVPGTDDPSARRDGTSGAGAGPATPLDHVIGASGTPIALYLLAASAVGLGALYRRRRRQAVAVTTTEE